MEQFKTKQFEQPRERKVERETNDYKIVGQTDIGLKRQENEDDFFIGEDLYRPWGAEFEVVFGDKYKNTFEYIADQVKPEDQGVFEERLKVLIEKEAPTVLCDGLGGHGFGAEASRIASQIYFAEYLSHRIKGEEMKEAMTEALFQANQVVYNFNRALIKACEDDNLKQEYEKIFSQGLDAEAMTKAPAGSTLVASAFDRSKNEINLINVGDSRAYISSMDRLNQITTDHSVANELISSGRMTEEKVKSLQLRNILSINIGSIDTDDLKKALKNEKERFGFDWEFSERAKPGDLVILCSDGLTDTVEDPEITKTISKTISQGGEITENLVEQAKANGGRDNITVVTTILK